MVSVAARFQVASSAFVSSVKLSGFQRTVMRSVPSLTFTKVRPGLLDVFCGVSVVGFGVCMACVAGFS